MLIFVIIGLVLMLTGGFFLYVAVTNSEWYYKRVSFNKTDGVNDLNPIGMILRLIHKNRITGRIFTILFGAIQLLLGYEILKSTRIW